MRRLILLLIIAVVGLLYCYDQFRRGNLEIPYVTPQPETIQSETSQSETSQPETVQPGTIQSETSQPRTNPDAREWRILALIIEETALERLGDRETDSLQGVRFTSDEKQLIRIKHEEFEAWLAETTGGRLRARTDILEVPGPITSLSVARGDQATDAVEDLAYWAGPRDVAPLVDSRLPAGRYQSVIAWVKVPGGVRLGGGALTSPTMLRGSPFASHNWFQGRRYTRDMMFAGISHEFYHQITFWLTRELGYNPRIFPSNQPPNTITVDGEVLLPADGTRRRWYTHVLTHVVTDRMWDAMLRWQRENTIWSDGNLAYDARPIGGTATGEVRDLDKLNDGSLGSDNLRDAAATHPPSREPVEAWFGLEFDEPTMLSRVTAYPRFQKTDTSYLALSFVVEYEVDGRWRTLRSTSRSGNEKMKVDIRFNPIRTRGIRLRILVERPGARGFFYRASCLELEVYR